MKKECPFCAELQDKTLNPLRKHRIVCETEHFVVFPTVGCLVVNYLLVVPKKHHTCIGHLSDAEYRDLNIVLKKIHNNNNVVLRSSTIMYEHGSAVENPNAGNSVFHAHLHVLPLNDTLKDDAVNDNVEISQINSICELSSTIKKAPSYLYYSDTDGSSYEILHSGVESQYFRRLLSKRIGRPDMWNWREYPFFNNMEKTLDMHRKYALCS